MSENNNDKTESTGFINHAIIDRRSGVTSSGSTSIPSYLFKQERDDRSYNASRLIYKAHPEVKEVEGEMSEVMSTLLEKADESAFIQKGNNFYLFNSQIYGSIAGGDVQQNWIYVEKWTQVKNEIDTDRLLAELEKVIELAKNKANTNEHLTDLAYLTLARDELRKADGPAMLKYLKKVGSFGRDIAVGVISGYLDKLMSGQL